MVPSRIPLQAPRGVGGRPQPEAMRRRARETPRNTGGEGQRGLNPYDRFARVILPLDGGMMLVTVVAVGRLTQPDEFVRGYAPQQPIPLPPRLHAGTIKIPCQCCHTTPSRSRHGGTPAVETCMNRHRVTKTDRLSIRRVAAIYDSGRPLAQRRVHRRPDHVYFDHRQHVDAGIVCQRCHGEVETVEVFSQRMSMRTGSRLGCDRDAHGAFPPPPR